MGGGSPRPRIPSPPAVSPAARAGSAGCPGAGKGASPSLHRLPPRRPVSPPIEPEAQPRPAQAQRVYRRSGFCSGPVGPEPSVCHGPAVTHRCDRREGGRERAGCLPGRCCPRGGSKESGRRSQGKEGNGGAGRGKTSGRRGVRWGKGEVRGGSAL